MKNVVWTPTLIVQLMDKRRIAFGDGDVAAALVYLKSKRICRHYDALEGWVRMMVQECEKYERGEVKM